LASADIPGIGTVYIDGVAEEETMARILQVLSSAGNANSAEYQQQLAQSAKYAASSIKQTSRGFSGLSSDAQDASANIGGLGASAAGAKRYMQNFGSGMTSLGQTLNSTDPYGLSKGLVSQAASLAGSTLSGIGDAFGPIGSMLGGVAAAGVQAAAALTGVFIGAMSKTTAEFNKMQASGALFGGDLINTRQAAHGAGLTMEQLSGVVGKAGNALATFGGTTSKGAREFGKANSQLIASQGEQMLRMGIGFEDMGVRTAEFMETVALSGQKMGSFGTTTADIAAGTARLAKQQKIMSALNGESIEAEKAKQRAVRQDAAFQATISTMSLDQRNEMEALLRQFPHLSGAIKEAALTGDAFSAEGAMAVENAGLMGTLVMDAIKNVRDGVNVTGQMDNVIATAEANAEQIAKDQAKTAELASMSIFGTGNAAVESALGQFLPLQEASMKANTQAYSNIKSDMETLENTASAATTAMTTVANEFQSAQVNISKAFTGFLESGGGEVMIQAVTLPIKALGAAIELATDMIPGGGGGQLNAAPGTAPDLIAQRSDLAQQLNNNQRTVGALSGQRAQGSTNQMSQQVDAADAARIASLNEESEKIKAKMQEIDAIVNPQTAIQNPNDTQVGILQMIYKALTDQNDTLSVIGRNLQD